MPIQSAVTAARALVGADDCEHLLRMQASRCPAALTTLGPRRDECATVRELLEVLRELEAMQAFRAAGRASEQDMLAMQSSICGMRAATRDAYPARYWLHAAALHDVIEVSAGHETSARIARQVRRDLAASRFVPAPHAAADSLSEHELLVDRIAAGDADGAHLAMFDHLSSVIPVRSG